MTETTTAAQPTQSFRTIDLDEPIVRGGQTIAQLQLRKPRAGDLRGLSLGALHQADYGSLETLLPRITIPTLTKQDVAGMDPADLTQCAGEVLDFLLPRSSKPDSLGQ